VRDLVDTGVPLVEFGQGYVSMNAPMKEFERRYLAGELKHPNNPLLTWTMKNVVARQDPAGNIKPDKEKSREKIDPAVALIMAAGGAVAKDVIDKPELIIL